MNSPAWVSVNEVAEAFGVPARTVRYWIATGVLPAVHVQLPRSEYERAGQEPPKSQRGRWRVDVAGLRQLVSRLYNERGRTLPATVRRWLDEQGA